MTSLKTPQRFRDTVSEADLEDALPDSPLTSLKDIQYVYGKLFVLSTIGSSEYGEYLTPTEGTGLFGEEESLIEVFVDISGDEAKIDTDQPVRVTEYNEHLVSKVAYSKYANKGSGIDHSVTHQIGTEKPPEDLAGYALDRITRWPTEDAIQEVAETHEDGWILEKLATLGRELDSLEEGETSVEQAIMSHFTDVVASDTDGEGDETKSEGETKKRETRALFTLRLKVEEGGEYLYPGEIEVMNAGTRAQKLSKLVSKGEAKNSSGEAVSYVLGDDTTTVGTATDPLNFYLTQQHERFPNFDIDKAWTSFPLGQEEAVTILQSQTFIDACMYRSYQARVYALPYLMGDLSADDGYLLYTLLYRAFSAEDSMSPIESAYTELDGLDDELSSRLRFHTLYTEMEQASRYNVFGETPEGTLLHPVEISQTHQEVLDSWLFDANDRRETPISAPFATFADDNLLAGDSIVRDVANGDYVYRTCARGGDDPAADDDRISLHSAMLAGEPISERTLLKNYVQFLFDRDTSDQPQHTDSISEAGVTEFPTYKISQQFAQHETLRRAGLLTDLPDNRGRMDSKPITEFNTNPMPDDTTDADDDVSNAELREQKLIRMLEESEVLQDIEPRACFLTGVLVGEVSSYQHLYEDRSTTLIDQYSVSAVSKNKIKRLIQNTLDKNFVYSSQNNLGSGMYAEVTDRLTETLTQTDPDEWEIGRDEIRYYYSLGVAYGLNNYVESDNGDEQETEEEPATA